MAEHTVLIVEDDATVRELLKYRLGKHYTVSTAVNGEDALDHIRTYEAPDLIISDIMMPKMDGFALQAELQADKNMRVIPFIFLTARADEPTRRDGIRTGVDDYITKPFDMEHLLSRVERLIERAQVYQTNLDAKIGRDFSNRLLPKDLPEAPGYRVRFKSEAFKQGGGDLFDWLAPKPGGDRVVFTFGDVMGKGLQAKFYAYSFLAYIRSTVHTLVDETEGRPAELLTRLNSMVARDEVLQETFASLLLMSWDRAAHTFTYANAGHCRPILATAEGAGPISEGGLILGVDAGAVYEEQTLDLPPGSALFVYTDGLMEQTRPSGEMLGEQGVTAAVQHAYGADDPVAAVRAHLLEQSAADTFEDDVFFFWLEREGRP